MHSKGFTLIELLVVVAIIGTLASIVLGYVNVSRSKANDTKRDQEVTQIENALVLMQDDNGHFPCHYYQNDQDPSFLKPYLTKGLLSSTPHDPSGGFYVYEYATLKSSPNPSRCGDIVFLGLYFENPDFHCPPFGVIATDGPNHCHIYYPAPPPCPAFNVNLGPIANTGTGAPCQAYGDPPSQNEY